jgi:hypothetical protein
VDNATGCTTCHVDSSNNGSHASHVSGNRQIDLRRSAVDNAATAKSTTQICDSCHGGSTAAGTAKSQWDNQTVGDYANVTCLSCHGTTPANTKTDGAGGVAPDMAAYWTASGHGKSGIQKACTDCHGYALKHYGAPATSNPWRLTQPAAGSGDLDAFCANPAAGCHQSSLLDHFWIVAKGQAKLDNETHSTSIRAYPSDSYKQRWHNLIADEHVVVSGDIENPYPHAFNSATDNILCVSCHDPHGVGSSVPASRKFAGVFTDNVQEQKMMRFNYRTGAPAPLCAKCHK